MARVHIGIGSNLGDRLAHLEAGLGGLTRIGTVTGGSSIYETAPVGDVEQEPFLNAVIAVETECEPREVLDALLAIEATRGRRRDVRWGPRTLDLDLLTFGGTAVDEPGLTVPHPEIRNRRFVLVPLVQVDPHLTDSEGLYADALERVSDQEIRRVSGPLHPDGTRWLLGLEEAIDLTAVAGGWTFECHLDWANSSGDMFGAYLSAVSLLATRSVAPQMAPTSFTHRFIHGVPVGSTGRVSLAIDRQSERSIDVVVMLMVDEQIVGRSTISALARVPDLVIGPPVPSVTGIESTVPIGDLIAALDRSVGMSASNWGPLENWDSPDLAGGIDGAIRLWSPNAGIGWDDPYLTAASMLMPIDAAIWPAAMYDLGLLPNGPAVFTPTVEFSATFADVGADDLYHLAEARIEHRTASSVSGTIRIWGDDGGYRATGRSYNLVRGGADR
jgi:2-amino-4-hydroxy-6-hydroxymethyldihydropteridine diphosphokinase